MDVSFVDTMPRAQMPITQSKTTLSPNHKKLLKQIEQIADQTITTKIQAKFNKTADNKNHTYLYFYKSPKITTRSILFKKALSTDDLLTAMHIDGNIIYKNNAAIKNAHNQIIQAIKDELIEQIPSSIHTEIRGALTILQAIDTLLEDKAVKLIGTLEEMTTYINKYYEENSDLELLKTLHKLRASSLKGQQYIIAAVTKPVVIEMSQKAANKIPLLAYLTDRLTTIRPSMLKKDTIIKHPGQIIQAIKHEYVIENKHWKHFLNMTPSVLNYDNSYISVLLHIGQNKPSSSVTKLLQNTMLPSLMDTVRTSMNSTRISTELTDENKKQQLATLQKNYEALCALPSVVHGTKSTDFHNFQYELQDTLDYLRARHRETGVYPRHYTWNSYIKHTREWHHAVRREQAIRSAGNKLYNWNTLIPSCEIDEYEVKALIDSAALVAEGAAMHHCVGGYWRNAIDADYRLFHIEHKENPKDAGTLCLSQARRGVDGMIVNQLRGPYNSNVSEPLQKVANKVLRRYQNMYRRTEDRLRVWNQTIDYLTNEIIKTTGFPDEDVTKLEEEIDLEALELEEEEPNRR